MQQLKQIAARMGSGPRGAGVGLKLLIGAGALAYGVKEATFTGRLAHLKTPHTASQTGPCRSDIPKLLDVGEMRISNMSLDEAPIDIVCKYLYQ
jgi:hypothetical protein